MQIFKQIYLKADVDALLLALRSYIDEQLAKKQNWVTSDTAPSNPSEWDLWYDTVNDALQVYDGTQWTSIGWWATYTAWDWIDITNNVISADVQISSQTGNLLTSWMKIWAWTESDYSNLGTYDTNTLYLTV